MFPSPKSSRPAYTLVELLLFTGILSLMAGSIVGFSVLSTNVSTRTETMAEVEQGGELVMQRILQEIQNTDFIVYPPVTTSSDTLVLATVSPKREVVIHLFHDRIRMIENGTEISFLTTEHIGIDDLSFLHFGGSGAGEGISITFLGYNKSIGTTLYKKQYSRTFRGTAVLHGSRCSTDTDCSGGDTCCSGICREACLDDCDSTSDCTGNDVCCILNLSSGDSECLSASACETAGPKCASLQDCPISEPYFLVSGVKIFCNQTNCQYTVPVCTGANVCSNVALGPCDVCSTCGDGSTDVTRGEECDDGDTDNADICTCTCTIAKCGDNIIQPLGADDAVGGGDDEDCDDGNTKDDDGCDSDCQNENLCVGASNNGTLEEGEECDDGNASNTDTCDNLCRVTVCGDGTIQSPNGHGINELCDDGNVLNADACSSICQTVTSDVCGNGILEAGEDCDDGKRCTLTGNTCQEDAGCPGAGNVCNGANIDGCTTPGACIVTQTPESTCNDFSDNDCDGFTDCVDVDCDGLACATGTCGGGTCVAAVCGNAILEPPSEECENDGDCTGGEQCASCQCEAVISGDCAPGNTCPVSCPTSANQWELSVAGVTPTDSCGVFSGNCSDYNGNYTLSYLSGSSNGCQQYLGMSACLWCWDTGIFIGPSGCGYDVPYADKWMLSVSADSLYMNLDANNIARYRLPIANWQALNCKETAVFDFYWQESASANCNWPATLTITPVGLRECDFVP
jgi:cysteine-rich repeat protein